MKLRHPVAVSACLLALGAEVPAQAQQPAPPGSAAATKTLGGGAQIPPPPQKFGGVTAAASRPVEAGDEMLEVTQKDLALV